MSKKLVGLAVLLFCLSTPLLADHKRARRQYRRAPAQFAVTIVTPYGAGFVSGGGPDYGHRYMEYDRPPRGHRHYRESRYKKRYKSKKRHRHQHYCDRRH